jgi:hypothetical protein
VHVGCQRGPVLLLEREGQRGTEQQFRQVPCRSKGCPSCRHDWDELIVSNCTPMLSHSAYFLILISRVRHPKCAVLKRALRRAGASWIEIPQDDGRRWVMSSVRVPGFEWGMAREPEKALRAALSRHNNGRVNSSLDLRAAQRVSSGWKCCATWQQYRLAEMAAIIEEHGFYILAWYGESFYMQHSNTEELLRAIEEEHSGD